MQIEIVSPDSPRWLEIVSGAHHDVYQLPSYSLIASRQEGGRPAAILAQQEEHQLLLPLLVREIPESESVLGRQAFDCTSPYGYPGMLLSGPAEAQDGFLDRALSTLPGVLAGSGIVALFVRLHPILPLPSEPLRRNGRLVEHGQTIGIDLTADDHEIFMGIKNRHRRSISKLEEHKHEVVITSDESAIDEFLAMYEENMDRVGADSYYYFPRAYFEDFLRLLPGYAHLAFLRVDGAFACADLLTEVDGIVQAHLGATRTAFLSQSPSIPLTYYECRWAKERGDRLLHLGGGVGGSEDSLFAFKAGFSKLRFSFATWRLVADEAAYRMLTREWERLNRMSAEDRGAFFPAYRRKVEPLALHRSAPGPA